MIKPKTCAFFLIFFIHISSIKNELIPKPGTGTKCEWEGKNGTCVNYWNCVTNAIDKTHGIQPPVCKNEGNDGKVYTCCTSCYVTANISSIVIFNDKGLLFTKTGKKSRDKCIDYLKDYEYPCYHQLYPGKVSKNYVKDMKCYGLSLQRWAAAGGVDAERAEFPHMVRYRPKRGEVQFVALGILKRSDPPSLWQVYRVDTFIAHPKYRPPSNYHDIALIRTEREITFGGPVLPACLAQGDENMSKGDATGWGALGHRKRTADVLQKVDVNEFNSKQCSDMYTPHRHLKQGYNHTTQMCYGDSDVGKDTCSGDSGGPLQLDKCPHVVFGVTSSGHPCGFAGGAGLYTRVTYYVPWIESIVWP